MYVCMYVCGSVVSAKYHREGLAYQVTVSHVEYFLATGALGETTCPFAQHTEHSSHHSVCKSDD